MHLDVVVDNLDAAETGTTFRVFLELHQTAILLHVAAGRP
jgi:hypothetical protein